MAKDDHGIAGTGKVDVYSPDDAVRRPEVSHVAALVSALQSTDQRWRQRLAAGVTGIELVPELDLGLTEPPTQENLTAVHLAREVDGLLVGAGASDGAEELAGAG